MVLVDDIKTLEYRDLWLSWMRMFGLQFFLALCSNMSGGVKTLLERRRPNREYFQCVRMSILIEGETE